MWTTTIGVKGGHFTGFIYTVLLLCRHISNQINYESFYQILLNSAKMGKFCGNGYILWIGSKFCSLWKTVGPNNIHCITTVWEFKKHDYFCVITLHV